MSRLPSLILLIVAAAGCAATDPTRAGPFGPVELRGLVMTHTPTADDSVLLSKYGVVVSMVRLDSTVLILSDADRSLLDGLPGVAGSGPALGTTATTGVEILIGVGAVFAQHADSASAIMTALGKVYGPMGDGVIDGVIAANRLGALDAYSAISYVYVNIDPIHIDSRAH